MTNSKVASVRPALLVKASNALKVLHPLLFRMSLKVIGIQSCPSLSSRILVCIVTAGPQTSTPSRVGGGSVTSREPKLLSMSRVVLRMCMVETGGLCPKLNTVQASEKRGFHQFFCTQQVLL